MRLLRIVSILVREFYALLVRHTHTTIDMTMYSHLTPDLQGTECEIFLSMLVKFLEADKPFWLRTLAVEVLRSICSQPLLLRSVNYILSIEKFEC